jgi:hypothetical protein
VLPTPQVEAATGWTDAWLGFDLDMQFRNRSINTIANRKCNVSILARHATADGITDPEQVTRLWLQQYLVRQGKDRKGNGYMSLFQDLAAFWTWWSADAEKLNPMVKIPRPATVTTSVPVLSEEQLAAILGYVQRARVRLAPQPRAGRALTAPRTVPPGGAALLTDPDQRVSRLASSDQGRGPALRRATPRGAVRPATPAIRARPPLSRRANLASTNW